MAISQIAALTAHISFLLSELIFGTPGVGRSSPHQMAIVDSYSENSYLSDQVLADLPPIKWQFHRLLLWQLIFHSYSQNSYLADQVLADVPPLFNADFTDSCFDHSYSIPNLRTHIWQTRCWQIYPPSNGNFTDCCSDSSYFITTLRTHIWHTRCWQI